MQALHQAAPAVIPGDAVSDQVFRWNELLRAHGHRSEIVVDFVHPELDRRRRALVHTLDRGGRALLTEGGVILHYAIASPVVDAAVAAPGPLALCYHNVTPPELIRDWNPALAASCELGRRQLATVGRHPIAVRIAASRYNASEINAAGLGEAVVVPYILDLPERPIPPRTDVSSPVVLHVGRVAPNKRIEDVIKVFALYQRHCEPESSLVLVGPDESFASYRRALDRLVDSLDVHRVWFTGRIADEARDAEYASASAYLSMSVHEGFGIPLVEALSRGVPVVARAAAAVPETIGGAGIVLDDDDLALYAEALHEVVSSRSTRAALGEAAAARLFELSPDETSERLYDALEPMVSELRQ